MEKHYFELSQSVPDAQTESKPNDSLLLKNLYIHVQMFTYKSYVNRHESF